jgi:dihydrofolate synthase / folylpolyglutamate synthase
MNDETAYQQALDYIYTFVDYSLQRTFHLSPDKFDLGRMRAFTALLGNPHLAYPVIHVAGTKGKGSVTALCASALHAAGYRVGVYTSPHLQDYAERIQVDGEPIPHGVLAAYVEELKPLIPQVPELTTFEITTALGFLYFDRQDVDIAVIEVGLGGRLDATNVVNPLVSVITSISYDHTDLLGHTLAEIAGEKAGIIKPAVPVVVSPQKEEAAGVFVNIARERQSPLIQVGDDYRFAPISHSLKGQDFFIWPRTEQELVDAFIRSGGSEEWRPRRLFIPLLGSHQVENAATAYAALQTARVRGVQLGEGAIETGFRSVYWPGRFELLQEMPPVLIDSAHNADSALRLRQSLDDYFPGHPIILIIGASEDKDIEGMFAELMQRASQVIATRSVHPRAADPERLVEIARRFGKPAAAVPRVEDALEVALLSAGPQDVVLAAGSIFLAAAVRSAWQERTTDSISGA